VPKIEKGLKTQVMLLREEINAIMIYLDGLSDRLSIEPHATSLDNVWYKALDEWNKEILVKDTAHQLTLEIVRHAMRRITFAVKNYP
jgi:hypothetical protein